MVEWTVQEEQDLFTAGLEVPAGEQAGWLARVCPDKPALRERVLRLLGAHRQADQHTLTLLEGFAIGQVPDAIGPYRLVSVIGEGGMGVVYQAEQTEPVQRTVALKIVKLGMDTQQVVARFLAERQALAAMDHPFVAKVFDGGQTVSGRPYFVMERVQGDPLVDYCNKQRLSARQRVRLFTLICQAVQHAHQKGVVHRDLKPSNILVSDGDTGPLPKVIDFGIAKAVTGDDGLRATRLTLGEQPVGTPAYMSPEQAGASPDIDTRSDIYALGVILYELLTGALPVDPREVGESRFLTRLAAGEIDPPRPSARIAAGERIPGDLDWVVMKAIEFDRTRRYDTAAALAEDLARVLHDEPVAARPPTASYRLGKFLRRHRVQAAAVAAVVVAIIAGTTAAGIGFVRATRAEAIAREEAATALQVSDFLTGLFSTADPNSIRTTTQRELLDRAAARIETDLQGQPGAQVSLYVTLGHVYGALGVHKEAAALSEKAIAIADTTGAETADTAEALLTLGRARQQLGDLPGAQQAFERGIAIRTRLQPEDTIELSVLLTNLGSLHGQLERYDEAIAMHTRALEIQRRLRGPESGQAASTLRQLGVIYARQRDYEKALAANQAALAGFRAAYGDSHPNTAIGYESVGYDLKDLERYDEARTNAERALEIRTKTLGPEHPQIAFTHALLGEIAEGQEQLDRAEQHYRESLRIREAALGPDNVRTGDILLSLGRLAARRADPAAATVLLGRAQAIYLKVYGPTHSRTVLVGKRLAEAEALMAARTR
jgi:serine/threonine protein kinase/tetratricopeptide (TPR) repeat protein